MVREKIATEIQALLDESPDAVLVVDREGAIVALNRRTETLFSTTAGQLLGQPIETLVPERLREAHAAARAGYSRAPTLRAMSSRGGLMGQRADGTEIPIEVSLTPIVGSAAGLVMAVVHQVAARVPILAEDIGAEHTAGALDAIADAVLTTDAAGNVDFLNRSAERLTGWSRETALGRPLLEVLPLAGESGGEPQGSPVAECLRTGLPGRPCETSLAARPGRESRALDISTTPIRDRSGSVIGAAVVARDVTHARRIVQRLSHQATHDALTGLVNRGEFERRLGRAVASAAAEPTEHALCFLDLDGFKLVNDAIGHLAGDELLRQLSDLMRERMRSRDTLARLGGDEFGMLLEHCRLPKAARIAEAIRQAICAHRFAFGGQTYAVGASIGIAPIRAGADSVSDLLRAADNACYLAKRHGGNRVQRSDRPRHRVAPRERDWVGRIVGAIEADRFQLHGQLLQALEGGHGRAPRLELLLRLVEDDGVALPPAVFLPAARRFGLMPRVDAWVLRFVVPWLSQWWRDHPGVAQPAVAINLGGETVMEGRLTGLVRDELAKFALPPGALCFEVSESVVLAHPRVSARLFRELRDVGCQTALDHCGSGMAAFTLLRRLQVDYLKIAGHIVRDLDRDPVHHALATALNRVGHVLHLRTIGVEVENPEALACLRRIGVDYAQGYNIGRPEPLETAFARLG